MNSISTLSQIKGHSLGAYQTKLEENRELPSGLAIQENEGINLENLNKTNQVEGSTFSEFLAKSLGDVNQLQQQANKEMEKLASGKSESLHETMLAVERAEIAFKTMNQVRSKILDAYKEVMRMQL